MKLNKNIDLFIVYTNESGKIIKLSNKATLKLNGCSVGDDIFEFIDADALRKLSMYYSKSICVKTTLEGYPNAFMISKTVGGIKTVEVCFLGRAILPEGFVEQATKILSLLNGKRSEGNSIINVREYLGKILEELVCQKHMEGVKITFIGEDQELKTNTQRLELLFLTTLSVMNDINFKGEIQIQLLKNKLQFALELKDRGVTEDIDKICTLYPQVTSKLYLLRSICEDEGIGFKLNKTATNLLAIYDFAKLSRGKTTLMATSAGIKQRILSYIDILF